MNADGWLDRFIAVPENRPALIAVQALAERVLSVDATVPELVLVHGPPGSGKTHLVKILEEHLADTRQRPAVGIFDARTLFADRQHTGFFAELDVLVVEDLQFLSLHYAERFANLLDERRAAGLATLATAIAGPRHLRARGQRFPARLASRLSAGLVVGLEHWKLASRRAFLDRVAARRRVTLPPGVAEWLADNLTGLRSLEAAIAQIEILSRIGKGPLRRSDVLEHLKKQVESQRPTVERIVGYVAGHYHVPARELRAKSRQRSILVPRHVSMYLARQLTPLSLKEIGDYFGGCDHSTVLHACRKMETALESDPALCGTVQRLQEELM